MTSDTITSTTPHKRALDPLALHQAAFTLLAPHLDPHSIYSYLRAFPELQDQAALITDHAMPPLFFGGLSRVRRFSLVSSQVVRPAPFDVVDEFTNDRIKIPTFDRYDKHFDKKPITLIEVTRRTSFDFFMRQEQGMTKCSQHQDVYVDSRTFLFLGIPPYSPFNLGNWVAKCVELEHKLHEFTESKWHVGTRTFFGFNEEQSDRTRGLINFFPDSCPPLESTSQGIVSWGLPCLSSMAGSLKTLATLRIENVEDLPDFLELPNVVELSMVFNFSSRSVNHRPRIHALNAPSVRRCVVHFSSRIPLFTDCIIGSSGFPPEYMYNSFEFGNTSYLDRSTPNFKAQKYPGKEETAIDPLELPFLLNFSILVIGANIPLSLFEPEYMANISALFLHVAHKDDLEGIGDSYLPSFHDLRFFVCHITGSNITIPVVTRKEYICVLSLTSFGLDNDISKPFRSIPQSVGKCVIYSSPLLLRGLPHDSKRLDRILKITRDDWMVFSQSIGGYIPAQVGTLSISGIDMSFLQMDNTREPSEGCACRMTPSNMTLRPIFTAVQGQPLDIHINVFIFQRSMPKWAICPMLVDEKGRIVENTDQSLEVTVHIDHPVDRTEVDETDHFYRCTLAVSTDVTSVFLGGTELQKEVTEEWKTEIKKVSGLRYHSRTHVESHRWDIPFLIYTDDNPFMPRERHAEFNAILYNPFVRFPGQQRPYTVYMEQKYMD